MSIQRLLHVNAQLRNDGFVLPDPLVRPRHLRGHAQLQPRQLHVRPQLLWVRHVLWNQLVRGVKHMHRHTRVQRERQRHGAECGVGITKRRRGLVLVLREPIRSVSAQRPNAKAREP